MVVVVVDGAPDALLSAAEVFLAAPNTLGAVADMGGKLAAVAVSLAPAPTAAPDPNSTDEDVATVGFEAADVAAVAAVAADADAPDAAPKPNVVGAAAGLLSAPLVPPNTPPPPAAVAEPPDRSRRPLGPAVEPACMTEAVLAMSPPPTTAAPAVDAGAAAAAVGFGDENATAKPAGLVGVAATLVLLIFAPAAAPAAATDGDAASAYARRGCLKAQQ